MAFVRAAWPADAEAIATIQLRAWRERYSLWPRPTWNRISPGETVEAWRDSLGDVPSTGHQALVATDGAGLVRGFATLAPDETDTDHTLIELLEVDPVHRRAGHGSRLLCAAAALAAGRAGLLIWIDQGSEASRFLVDSGWGPRGRRRVLEVGPDAGLAQHQWWTSIGDA